MDARVLSLSRACRYLSFSDLQGERATVETDGLLHGGSGWARRRGGVELLPLLRESLQQPRDADVREVRGGATNVVLASSVKTTICSLCGLR